MSKSIARARRRAKQLHKEVLNHMAKNFAAVEDYKMFHGRDAEVPDSVMTDLNVNLLMLKLDYPSSWWRKL